MEILARGVGRRKEAIAQVQIIKGTGKFIINNLPAQQYLHNNTCSLISVKSPFVTIGGLDEIANTTNSSLGLEQGRELALTIQESSGQKELGSTAIGSSTHQQLNTVLDTIVKVKGGGLVGQAEAIKLGLARALCQLKTFESINSNNTFIELHSEEIRKNFKDKGLLTQDSRVKERRKYGLKKARKASQYHKR
jgi:small subunit ribosomal protein S9